MGAHLCGRGLVTSSILDGDTFLDEGAETSSLQKAATMLEQGSGLWWRWSLPRVQMPWQRTNSGFRILTNAVCVERGQRGALSRQRGQDPLCRLSRTPPW